MTAVEAFLQYATIEMQDLILSAKSESISRILMAKVELLPVRPDLVEIHHFGKKN